MHVAGVVHELAAGEVLAVAEDLLQLQVAVLVLVGDGDHLLGLVQSVVLVHRVHVLLRGERRGERSVNPTSFYSTAKISTAKHLDIVLHFLYFVC